MSFVATSEHGRRHTDVLIIGGGQAGIAAAHAMKAEGIDFLLLEADSIGSSWQKRWDGLTLFSNRSYSALDGTPMRGDAQGYPDKEEMARYLIECAAPLADRLIDNSRVIDLTKGRNEFTAMLASGRSITATAVVVATGPFQVPKVTKSIASGLHPEVRQLTIADFDKGALAEGRTLIVGGGASGRQIASLLATSHEVWLACRSRVHIQPYKILGVDTMELMDRLGILWAAPSTIRGRLAMSIEAFPGPQYRNRQLASAGVKIVKAACKAQGSSVQFADGQVASFRNVIWAAGYRTDDSWINIPGATEDGQAIQKRGISPIPGLYFLGRSFQTCRASALICGVSRDALLLRRAIVEYRRTSVSEGHH